MILDFKLDMEVYNYNNEKEHVCDSFNKLSKNNLCFLQDLSITDDHWYCKKNKCSQSDCHGRCNREDIDYDCDNCEYLEEVDALEWFNSDRVEGLILKESTNEDIETFIKEYFDFYNIKYDYVKAELL